MKIRHIFLLSFLSLLLFFSTVPLAANLYGYGGHKLKFFLTLIFYFLATVFSLGVLKNRPSQIVGILIILLPPLLIMGFIYLRSIFQGDFQDTKVSWVSSCAYIIGIGFGYLVNISNRIFKLIFSVITISFLILMFIIGYNYSDHYLFHNSFTGRTLEYTPDFKFTDKYLNIFQNSDFNDRTFILDFWFTRCGSCIEDMPKFEKLFQKYGRDGKILFYSINFPISSDTLGFAESLVQYYGFTFPILYTDKETINKFSIKYYPTYFVIKNRQVIFRGDIDNLETFLEMNNLKQPQTK